MAQSKPILAAKYRYPGKGWRPVTVMFPVIALALGILQTFNLNPFGFLLLQSGYLYLLIATLLPLCFLWIPLNHKVIREGVPWYDVVFVILGVCIPVSFFFLEKEIMFKGWSMGSPAFPFIAALLMWIVTIEAGRRVAGPAFAIFVLVFSFFPLFASYMPRALSGPAFSLHRVASYHIFGEESLIGLPMTVVGTLFLGYMVFSVGLQSIGAGKLFNDLAAALVGNARAGAAKIAIVSSGFFGSISGSAIANVLTTGTFTIPAMKKLGMPPHFAGAVEACASTGGLLMPPVMGVTAFIMAEFLGVSYAEVCIAAAVPSFLYYMVLYCQIDAHAARMKIGASPEVQVPGIWRTMLDHFHILAALVLLILILFLLRLTSEAPWYASALAFLLAMFRKKTRLDPRQLIDMLENVGKVLGELVAMLGSIGLVIGSLILTGVAFSLPYEIVRIAGGQVIWVLVLGAGAALILGMGVTISAVYIFMAIALAPGMVKVGFDTMAVHLFILYWAAASSITPPVATAAFAAAAIAGASPMKTGFVAMKLGMAKYILPFVFVLSPALILRGPLSEILWVIPSAAIGLIIMSGAMEGYFWWLGNVTWVLRLLLLGVGILCVVPDLTISLCGIGAFAALFALSLFIRQGHRSPVIRRIFLK